MNKKIINIISVIMCTVIGAGFASGKEIYRFFAQFGKDGFIGIIISSFFLGVIIYFSLKLIIKNKTENNIELIETIKAPKIFYYVINIFLLISFYVMIAGFSAYFKQEFKVGIFAPSIALCILLFIVLTQKVEWIIKLNTIIAPALFIIIIYISIKYNIGNNVYLVKNNNLTIKALINALLYASYNSIMLIPILITISKKIKSSKEILLISCISTIVITVLATLICMVLQTSLVNLEKIDLPIIAIINNKYEKYLYGIGIEIAIFTSAIAAGYGFLENIEDKNIKKTALIMCIIGIPISNIGFGNLVNILYPILGSLGIVQIILILKNAKGY